MIEHDKNFYSLEELKRTINVFEGCPDNEEVYYFIGSLRYANDEIERLNNIIKELEKWLIEQQKEVFHIGDKIGIVNSINIDLLLDKLQALKDSDKNE